MHAIVLFHSIICIKPRELLFSVILSPMSLCNPCLPSSTSSPSLSGSCHRGSCLPSLLLPSSSLPFFLSLPSLSLFFSSSSLHPLLIVSLLCSCSFFLFISLLSIIFKHPIFASILRSVLDVASTLSAIYLINSLLSFLFHLIVSCSLLCLSVQVISFYSSAVL